MRFFSSLPLHASGLLTFSRHFASSGYQVIIGLSPYGSCTHLVAKLLGATAPVAVHVRTVFHVFCAVLWRA